MLAISDVMGDELGAIGSGPCAPDAARAADVRRLLADAGLWDRLPPSLGTLLARAERDGSLETAKPGDGAFRRVESQVVAAIGVAVRAAADRAREMGFQVSAADAPFGGEATAVDARFAGRLLASCRHDATASPDAARVRCLIAGGETVVTLGADGASGLGGRCQELALAAARELARADDPPRQAGGLTWVLAAGTDGRDGPTDAAGAVIDADTWAAIRRAGRDPDADLARHDAYHALDAVGALLRTGPTGTNVADVVIGLCAPRD